MRLCLDSELSKRSVPWSNCIAFCADNTSVMLGQYKGVSAFIKKKNQQVIVHGCTCHLIYLAAQKASKELIGLKVEEFLVELYF